MPCAKCVMGTLFDPPTYPARQVLSSPHFTDGRMEAHGGDVIAQDPIANKRQGQNENSGLFVDGVCTHRRHVGPVGDIDFTHFLFFFALAARKLSSNWNVQ